MLKDDSGLWFGLWHGIILSLIFVKVEVVFDGRMEMIVIR